MDTLKNHHDISPITNPPRLTQKQYETMYARSLRDPKNFWSEQAEKFVTWFKRWDDVMTGDFNKRNVQWFTQGKLNACYNCVDRHLETRGKQTAILWENDDGTVTKKMNYTELYEHVCRFANVLKKEGIKKGDRACIYLPMIPEAAIAMLACARIGAIHTVVFAGFSPEALQHRIVDAECKIIITANEAKRGGKIIPLKHQVDQALKSDTGVKKTIVIQHTETVVSMDPKRDIDYHEASQQVAAYCPCEMIDAQDPFFILYTSGSTGQPKGILHTLGGYLVYTAMTFHYLFNYREGDRYWCTADVGWITGHSYLIYGPLCHGATTLLFEGIPTYPTPSRIWEVIDKHQVNILYTAPTAIRALRREGDAWVKKTSRKSLTLLGSVGEPINPDVWHWYYDCVGEKRCPVIDTWWQTETGGILISPIPGTTPLKPGSAAWPFFGVLPAIVDEQGKELPPNQMGKLIIKQPWPGMMHTIHGNRDLFELTYFKEFPGYYLTGDNAICDEEGYFWLMGRSDDVINVSGHRIGTGELEHALLANPSVAEAGVVSVPHPIKGESIYAFITLKEGKKPTAALKQTLIKQVREVISAIATPDYIQFADGLPKTRSGKIMRRLLKKIANHDCEALGDLSTLSNPEVIPSLMAGREKIS